ncbi:MAG TPA: c-type cytochrome [Pseudomonadales bacterium]|jgi:cytochrome c5|nr:c-type cytochrome [Pseudomonadales bacterium]HRG50417.1 c-type cytochrome [Pseudomonadales bacterium]
MKSMIKVFSLSAVLATVFAVVSVQAEDKKVADNTAPVGQTCLQGQPCAAAAAASSGGEPRTGEQVYNKSCTSCHTAGVAGAPKLGDAAAWSPRLAAGKETLYKHAIGGVRAMPPKGLCMDCSNDELKGAVDYMLSKVGK